MYYYNITSRFLYIAICSLEPDSQALNVKVRVIYKCYGICSDRTQKAMWLGSLVCCTEETKMSGIKETKRNKLMGLRTSNKRL